VSRSEVPLLQNLRNKAWLSYVAAGLYPLTWMLGLCVSCFQPGHWDWLTKDPEVLGYLSTTWRLLSSIAIGLGLFTVVLAATAYRRGEKWAWALFWYWPIFLVVYIPSVHPWTWPITVPLLVATTLSQLTSAGRALAPSGP